MLRIARSSLAVLLSTTASIGSMAAGDDITKKTATMEPAVRDGGLTYTVECAAGTTKAEDCSVDKDTYVGWRAFGANCQQCHGGGAMGSTFAPNLMERFNDHVDHERFVYVLNNGYTGNMGAMPSFAANPNVLKDVDALYRYLRARADGVLPNGRPKKQK